jgi:hypothetical protein
MKRIYFACLFLCLTTFLLSQSNQNTKVVLPLSASQADSKAQATVLGQHGKLPLAFEPTPLSVTVEDEIGNNGIPHAVQVTDDGNTLLLASFDSCVNNCGGVQNSDGGLYTYSLTTPANPSLEAHAYQIYPPYKWAAYYSVAYSSATYSAFIADADGYLQAFNVSSPASPTFESGASICCQGMSVVLSLDRSSAFIADSGNDISQFDVSNPNNMTLTSSIQIDEQIWYMTISPDGKQLLALDQGYVAIIDISSGTLGAVTVISQNPVLSGSNIGNGTYIANRLVALVGFDGVTIVDVTNPAAPVIIGTLSLAGEPGSGLIDYAATFVKTTGLTYLIANNIFFVLNTSAPSSPYVEGSATLPSGSGLVSLDSTSVVATADGSLAYVVSQGLLDVVAITPTISTTTAVTSSVNPSALNQQVTFAATVTGQGGATPTGTVTFSDGSTTLGTSPLYGGTAMFSTAALAVGLHSINGAYSGDSKFSGSSASLNQTVNQASTALMLISSLNPSGLDQPVTFTATITPQYGGQATGTVTFKDGATTLGSAAVNGNVANLTTSGLAIGTHSITTVYSGDSNFTGSTSNTVSQVVTKATTTTTLLSSINPSVQGKPVTFTAVVSSLAGTPTGKIKYLNGTTVLATLTLTSGSAKYTTPKLPPGANSITAVYEGDSNNSGSTSAPVSQFVLATTTTTLTSSPNPSAYGQTVAFTAVLTSSIGAPPDGETVTFKQGTSVLGTGTLSSGSASFTTSTLKVGTTAVKAVYSGDSNFTSSTSKPISQIIGKATTAMALTSSQNSSTYGQPVTFTATVAPQFIGTPTGSVVFKDGTKTLKTVTLSGGVASYTTSTLTHGTHTITATYSGSTSFDGSSASLTQTVN